MADAHKTSVAGSLSTTFSEKLKITSAKIGGDQKELNVAIIKATTSQFHVVPKEKHVRTLKLAVHPSRQRRDVVHIITELHRRLQDSTDWLTALKTLITLHRLMRETEHSFMDELLRYSEGLAHAHGHGHVPSGAAGAPTALVAPPRLFCTDNFIDRTTSEGRFDFSEWVRAYGKYLEEQLSVYAALKWYVEQETPGNESRMRSLGTRDLLIQLPHLQRLQRRLLDCVPHGAAVHDPVVLFSLSLVVKESFKLYKAVSEGIINLADAFFEMDYHDASRGLEFYKESMGANEALSAYYTAVEQIDEIKRTMQMPKLSTPPADFLSSMEAYVAEAPRPLPAAGEAPGPAKKGVPLRKGKLMQSGGVRMGSGPSAAAVAAAAAAAPRDPGMVLPLPTTSQSADSGGHGGSAVDSPTAASGAAGSAGYEPAPAAPQDLLGDTGGGAEAQGQAAAAATASQKPAPSPLDLLSGLDFSFPVAEVAGGDGAGARGTGTAALSSNPFADAPLAPAALPQHAPPAMQPPAFGSANPFGEPMPSPASAPSGGFGGSGGFEWPAAAPQLQQQQQQQQPAWATAPPGVQQHQQQHQQQHHMPPMGYGAPHGGTSHMAVPSDDPFASFGAPSPAAAHPRPAGGAFWGSSPPAGSYAAAPSPPGTFGNELSKAALHDPFAALTGLPPKGSPGTAGSRPSPPRTGMYPSSRGGMYPPPAGHV